MYFNCSAPLNFIYNCKNVTSPTAFLYNSREGNLISVKIMFSKRCTKAGGREGRRAGRRHTSRDHDHKQKMLRKTSQSLWQALTIFLEPIAKQSGKWKHKVIMHKILLFINAQVTCIGSASSQAPELSSEQQCGQTSSNNPPAPYHHGQAGQLSISASCLAFRGADNKGQIRN